MLDDYQMIAEAFETFDGNVFAVRDDFGPVGRVVIGRAHQTEVDSVFVGADPEEFALMFGVIFDVLNARAKGSELACGIGGAQTAGFARRMAIHVEEQKLAAARTLDGDVEAGVGFFMDQRIRSG